MAKVMITRVPLGRRAGRRRRPRPPRARRGCRARPPSLCGNQPLVGPNSKFADMLKKMHFDVWATTQLPAIRGEEEVHGFVVELQLLAEVAVDHLPDLRRPVWEVDELRLARGRSGCRWTRDEAAGGWQPRRRRDPSPRTIHAAAAASPRPAPWDDPRGSRGVAATRPLGRSTRQPRRRRDSPPRNVHTWQPRDALDRVAARARRRVSARYRRGRGVAATRLPRPVRRDQSARSRGARSRDPAGKRSATRRVRKPRGAARRGPSLAGLPPAACTASTCPRGPRPRTRQTRRAV